MKFITVFTLACALVLGTTSAVTVYAGEIAIPTYTHYGELTVEGNTSLKEDEPTNLLEYGGKDLKQTTYEGTTYDLKSVTVTRYRQNVRIEYYLGDYNNSTLIGQDEGYADSGDSIRNYIMNVAGINEAFNQTISATYKIVSYHQEEGIPFASVPQYNGTDDAFVQKVLVAKTTTYTIAANKYQNKQDKQNPDPNGLTQAQIDTVASSDFWKVNSLNQKVEAIVGQTLNLKSLAQARDTYKAGKRTGSLSSFGIYSQLDHTFMTANLYTIADDTPMNIPVAVFYEVEDYDEPVVTPGFNTSVVSGVTINFSGTNVTWKMPSASENLMLDNEADKEKLSVYPFHVAADPFDHPEHQLPYFPANWSLKHHLSIDYHYVPLLMGTVHVYYRDADGNELGSETMTGKVDSLYTTQAKSFEGYTLIVTPNNITGFFQGEDIDVIYVYEKIGGSGGSGGSGDSTTTDPKPEGPKPEKPEPEKPEPEKPKPEKPKPEKPDVIPPTIGKPGMKPQGEEKPELPDGRPNSTKNKGNIHRPQTGDSTQFVKPLAVLLSLLSIMTFFIVGKKKNQ